MGTLRLASLFRGVVAGALTRVVYILVGVLGGFVLLDQLTSSEPLYSTVIIPAARIVEREIPGEIRWRDRIVYVYLQPDVRAVAPSGAVDDVARFCRPLLVPAPVPTAEPTPSVIRSLSHSPSWVPLLKDRLFVSSMNSHGDLIAEDFRVRPGFGVVAGLEPPFKTVVRYSRLAPLHELGEGFVWYLTFRLGEAIFKP